MFWRKKEKRIWYTTYGKVICRPEIAEDVEQVFAAMCARPDAVVKMPDHFTPEEVKEIMESANYWHMVRPR